MVLCGLCGAFVQKGLNEMILMMSLLLAFALAWPKWRLVRSHPTACYAACVAVDALTITAVWSGWSQQASGFAALFMGIFTQGGLAGALFVLVMYAGAVKNGGVYIRHIMPIRSELSIMASILTLGHNIAFGRTYFVRLFTMAGELRWNILAAAICSLVMIVILLPLFVTSFKPIRRVMSGKRWKKLQRWAYLFYGLMPVHIVLVNLTGLQEHKLSAIVNVLLYSVVFITYGVLRVRKALLRKNRDGWVKSVIAAGAALLIGIIALVFVPLPHQNEPLQSTANLYEGSYMDGKYIGAAIGYNGRLKVAVIITDGKISECRLTATVEDEPYQTRATDYVFAEAIRTNAVNIDSLSGATSTADALIEAIGAALVKAMPVNP